MTEYDKYRYCIDDTRCRLCQFQFEYGESVLVVLEDGRAPISFPFHGDSRFIEEERGIELHMLCRRNCRRRYPRVHCFHDKCYSFNIWPISSMFLAATEYYFSPSISYERQRQSRIKNALARILKLGLLRKIPLELCYMIVPYLVRECAIVTYQELVRDVHPSEFVIDLSQNVYAIYKRIEGVMYVQSLHNTPQRDGGGKRIFEAQQEHIIRKIYIAYDHLGIRSIHFALPSHDSLRSLCDSYGGLKVRRLLESGDTLSIRNGAVPGRGWPTPGLDCRLIDLDACDRTGTALDSLRMTYFDCNKPTIDGYSAAICGFHIAKLYAHHTDTSANFYKDIDDIDDDILWMYMPIDQDEYLSEIWAITAPDSICLIALLPLTSHDRGVVFGNYYYPETPLRFQLVDATTNRLSRIYFNDWDPLYDSKLIKYLGVDANVAKTDDVMEITCCVKQAATHRPIVGMLLRYSNGRRACVGQYRTDWAFDNLTVDPSRPLNIDFGKDKRRLPYVAGVNSRGLGGPGSTSRMDIPWHGRLEWWLTKRQCKLYHSEFENILEEQYCNETFGGGKG
ncbi:hypothetical protein F4859DRAFT_520317 [Xylaria cf. heliscus]|nr:hypothetical protein F4859DRAFT_520317 [Xylaria cf. heliscus]